MTALADDVLAAVRHLATTTSRLVIACDFDGVLAPLVDDPLAARPLPTAVEALAVLTSLPATHTALLSGRSRGDLERIVRTSQLPAAIELVGSHGWEDGHAPTAIDDAERDRHRALVTAAEAVAAVADGVLIEVKPASITVHFRTVAADRRDAVVAAIEAGPATVPGVHRISGKDVVEFAVVRVDKGVGMQRLCRRLDATGAFFMGDDVTDERAFAVLGVGDVGVKVGPGDTAAGWRVDDPHAAAELLTALAAARAAHTRE